MHKRLLAIFLVFCLVAVPTIPTSALTMDLQASIEQPAPTDESAQPQEIIHAENAEQPTLTQNSASMEPSSSSNEITHSEMTDVRRTQQSSNTKPFIVEGGEEGDPNGEEKDYYYDYQSKLLAILSNKVKTIRMALPSSTSSDYTIRISSPHGTNITLENISIHKTNGAALQIGSHVTSDVIINLSGSNSLISRGSNAGIKKDSNAKLIIQSANNNENDKLIVQGGNGGAGIGGNNITIKSGHITATGGTSAAGIGSGGTPTGTDTSNIIIEGGTVIAAGGDGAAGIGSKSGGNASNITISGGTVTANGTNGGSGIGGGANGNASNITISGGTVTANGSDNAAGIGGGNGGNAENIAINNGTITSQGGSGGAGIGGGYNGNGMGIKINSGTVTATGGLEASAIGIGQGGTSSEVTISGGTVTATGTGNSGIAIGGGTSQQIKITPSSGYLIKILTGNQSNGSNTAPIQGSPFSGETTIDGQILEAAKYFKSTTEQKPAPPSVRYYRINLQAEPADGGTINGGGRHRRRKEITVSATPNEGYRFVEWIEDGKAVSSEANYTFSVKKHRTLVAVFTKVIEHTLQKETTDPMHSWTISFNQKLEPSDITSENFYIQDEKGKILNKIRPVLLENKYQVRMENETRFEENKNYFLY